jgi:hypothetical protein
MVLNQLSTRTNLPYTLPALGCYISFFFFFFLVSLGGVRLRPLGTSATVGLLGCYITTQSTHDDPAHAEVCCAGTRLCPRVPMSYSRSAQDGEAKAQMFLVCGLQDAWPRGVQPLCNL